MFELRRNNFHIVHRAIVERQEKQKEIINGFSFSYFVDRSVIDLEVVLKMPKRLK